MVGFKLNSRTRKRKAPARTDALSYTQVINALKINNRIAITIREFILTFIVISNIINHGGNIKAVS